jgi:hypothetical protein
VSTTASLRQRLREGLARYTYGLGRFDNYRPQIAKHGLEGLWTSPETGTGNEGPRRRAGLAGGWPRRRFGRWDLRFSDQGHIYRVWTWIKPRIDDLVLDAFISLYASEKDARKGEGDELGGASGF